MMSNTILQKSNTFSDEKVKIVIKIVKLRKYSICTYDFSSILLNVPYTLEIFRLRLKIFHTLA